MTPLPWSWVCAILFALILFVHRRHKRFGCLSDINETLGPSPTVHFIRGNRWKSTRRRLPSSEFYCAVSDRQLGSSHLIDKLGFLYYKLLQTYSQRRTWGLFPLIGVDTICGWAPSLTNVSKMPRRSKILMSYSARWPTTYVTLPRSGWFATTTGELRARVQLARLSPASCTVLQQDIENKVPKVSVFVNC